MIGKNNIDVCVDKTKYLKKVGDKMKIQGREYIVIASNGSRNDMVSAGNAHVRMVNSGRKKDYWNQPTTV